MRILDLPPRKFEIGDIVRFADDDAESFTPCQIVGYVIENYSHCGPVWYYFVANKFNVSATDNHGYDEVSLVKVPDLPDDLAWYLNGVLPYSETENQNQEVTS